MVTGLDPFTRKRNDKGLVPRWLEFFGVNFIKADDRPDYQTVDRPRFRTEISPFGAGSWFEHPKFDDECIDIAVIPLGTGQSIDLNGHVSEYGFEELFHTVGNDVFVVGYPLGSYEGFMFPIWKRGSIAAEPLFQIDDKPMFLVDAATTPGMSGSPVFRRSFGPAFLANKTTKLDAAVTTEFVGVYAGNLNNAELGRVNVGYAWYGKLVDEIIDARCQGRPRG